VVVEQKGSFSFLFFSQDIEARLLVSAFPPNIIESQVLEGDFKIMNGRYDLRQVGNNVRLSFSGRLIPKFSLPPVIGMSIVRGILSLLQNSSFVGDLFAPAGELKEVRTAISGMMRFSSQTS
jgi:hypothetical protein